MNRLNEKKETAVWAVTPNGARLAARLCQELPDADLFVSDKVDLQENTAFRFSRLSGILAETFAAYRGHIFVMATGIVVRQIAPLLTDKTRDPAVVVMDELGCHSISLAGGHLGGANALALQAARLMEADPVITTATDLNHLPAIDVIAEESGLVIENPPAIKQVSMAFLSGRKVRLHDPAGYIRDRIPETLCFSWDTATACGKTGSEKEQTFGVWVDDTGHCPSENGREDRVLYLRPRSLFAGIGCNRGTNRAEIQSLLQEVFKFHDLSLKSLAGIASISIKRDEKGLLDTARVLAVPVTFYEKEMLSKVTNIPSPSDVVEKHTGVKSVCEAAAVQAAGGGRLVVHKQKTENVTVAVARRENSISWG